MSGYRDLRYPYGSGPPRASTSSVYETGFDTRFGPSSRSPLDYPTSRGRPYYNPPASRSTLDPSSASSASHGYYAPRPRRNSSTEPSSRAPLGPLSPEPYNRPVVRPQDLPRNPPPKIYTPKDESAGVIYPASSRRNHERHNSSTTEDFSRLSLAERDRMERQRSVHRNSYIGASRGYNTAQLPRHPTEDEYSYTGPREQFDRDYPARQARPRPEGYQRTERPVSMIDYGDIKPVNSSRREPPPSSVKHFERLDRGENRRGGSDTERDLDRVNRSHSTRHPVSVHQHERDDGYSSQRDDHHDRWPRQHERPVYEDDRYLSDRDRHHRLPQHERRSSKSRHERSENKEHSGVKTGIAAGLGAVAGLALKESRDDRKDKDKDVDYDKEARRPEKDRRRRERELQAEVEERERRDKPRDPRTEPDTKRGAEQPKEKSDSDSGHEKHRRRHRHKERAGQDGGSDTGSDHRTSTGLAGNDDALDDGKEHRRRHRHRHHRHKDRDPETNDEPQPRDEVAFVDSPVDIRNDESRPRKSVTVVEPPKEEFPETKPKGILKQPRPAFPEDPNPTREGVAPLKDAGKKGIPPGARWTKINRLLVNPAALEAAQERFEERDDYVIVLRVLTREEVQKLADKTKEIRGTLSIGLFRIFTDSTPEERDRAERERALREPDQQNHRKRAHGDDDRSYSDSDSSSLDSYLSDEDVERAARERPSGRRRESEHRERPLPLEPPPEHQPNLFAQFSSAAGQSAPQPVPVVAPPAQTPYQQAPAQHQAQPQP